MTRNVQVGSPQHGFHVVEQVPEEGPLRHHLGHHVLALLLQRGRQAAAEAVPAGQHVAALRPCEYPRNRPQRVDAVAPGARRRARSDVHAFDHVEGRRRAKVFEELRAAEDQFAVRLETACGDRLHRRRVCRRHRRPFSAMRRRQGHGRECAFERAHGDRTQAIALIDDFALLGQTQYAANGAVRHGLDQVLRTPAAARRRAAAAVKYQDLDAGLARSFQQPGLRHLQGPP